MSYFEDKSPEDKGLTEPSIIISPSKEHRLFNDETRNNIPNEVVVNEHQTDDKSPNSKKSESDVSRQNNKDLIDFLSNDENYGNIKLIESNEISYFSNKKQQLIGLQYFLNVNYDIDIQELQSEQELFETLMGLYKTYVLNMFPQWNNASLKEFIKSKFQSEMQHTIAKNDKDMLYILKKLHTREIIQYLSESLQNDFDKMDKNKNKSSDNKSNSVENNPTLVQSVLEVTSDENKYSEYGIEGISNVEAKQHANTLSNYSQINATGLFETNERRQQKFIQNQAIIENDMNQNVQHNDDIDETKTKKLNKLIFQSLNKFIKPELFNNNDDGDNGNNNSGNHSQNHNGNHNGNNGGNPYDKTDRIYPNQMEDTYWYLMLRTVAVSNNTNVNRDVIYAKADKWSKPKNNEFKGDLYHVQKELFTHKYDVNILDYFTARRIESNLIEHFAKGERANQQFSPIDNMSRRLVIDLLHNLKEQQKHAQNEKQRSYGNYLSQDINFTLELLKSWEPAKLLVYIIISVFPILDTGIGDKTLYDKTREVLQFEFAKLATEVKYMLVDNKTFVENYRSVIEQLNYTFNEITKILKIYEYWTNTWITMRKQHSQLPFPDLMLKEMKTASKDNNLGVSLDSILDTVKQDQKFKHFEQYLIHFTSQLLKLATTLDEATLTLMRLDQKAQKPKPITTVISKPFIPYKRTARINNMQIQNDCEEINNVVEEYDNDIIPISQNSSKLQSLTLKNASSLVGLPQQKQKSIQPNKVDTKTLPCYSQLINGTCPNGTNCKFSHSKQLMNECAQKCQKHLLPNDNSFRNRIHNMNIVSEYDDFESNVTTDQVDAFINQYFEEIDEDSDNTTLSDGSASDADSTDM